ncbi:hypothetical protein Plhal703r1_c11g0057781 [Plasmopara halstedii]
MSDKRRDQHKDFLLQENCHDVYCCFFKTYADLMLTGITPLYRCRWDPRIQNKDDRQVSSNFFWKVLPKLSAQGCYLRWMIMSLTFGYWWCFACLKWLDPCTQR